MTSEHRNADQLELSPSPALPVAKLHPEKSCLQKGIEAVRASSPMQ